MELFLAFSEDKIIAIYHYILNLKATLYKFKRPKIGLYNQYIKINPSLFYIRVMKINR